MTEELWIHIETEDLVRVPADTAVVGVFEGERPLRGAAGLVDWRLCGLLSELLANEALGGQVGQAVLLASSGRLAAPALLAIGLGDRAGWGLGAFEVATRTAFERIGRLGSDRVVLAPLGLDADDFPRHARAFVESALEGIGRQGVEVVLTLPEAEEARARRELIRAGRADRVRIVAPEPTVRDGDPRASLPASRP